MKEKDHRQTEEKKKHNADDGARALSDERTEIDPADFFDPEEFDYRRRGSHAPRP
jgi:hypothetical protein